MTNKDVNTKKKRVAAVDVLIFLLALLCIAGIAVRIAVGENGLFFAEGKGDYIVSYEIHGEGDEYSGYFAEGSEFFFEDGERFGTLTGNITLTPAEIVTKNSSGEYVLTYASDGTVDIKGTALVKGTMTDSGFLINSNTYIAPNMTLTVSSSDITAEILITDIAEVQ